LKHPHSTSLAALHAIAVALVCATSGAAPRQAPGGESDGPRAPERAECLRAHVATQQLRQAGKLVEASQQVRVCTSSTCPGPIVADCGTWLGELELATPSLVFEVEVDGHAAADAKVSVDGAPVGDWSHALDVNPGNHTVRVEVPSFPPHEEQVVMAEGHRMRLVSVQLASSKASAPAPAESPRPVPVVVYPLFGVGLAGLASFAVFDGLGRAKQTDLEHSCQPHCSSHDLSSMKTEYLVGDISLGVGVAALVGAAVAYFARPSPKPAAVSLVSWGVGPAGSDSHGRAIWEASAVVHW
jgi:PEGA domain